MQGTCWYYSIFVIIVNEFVSFFKVKIVPSKCNVKMFHKRDNTQYNTSFEFKSGTK